MTTTAIRCGKCKGRHESAAQVRDCYRGKVGLTTEELVSSHAQWTGATEEEARFELHVQGALPTAQDAINAEPKPDPTERMSQRSSISLRHVPAGRYAVEHPQDGKLRFLHVDKPADGKWKGWTFVKIQASDDLHKLGSANPKYGTYYGRSHALVARLAGADGRELEDYLARYGRELGVCGVCGRTLTDETSRELGIGPVCRNR